MECKRCGENVPDFLWMQAEGQAPDHLVLVDKPIEISREEVNEDNMIRVVVVAHTQKKLCSDVYPAPDVKIFDWTEETPLEEAIGQSIGAANVCWENMEGTGLFNSDRAKKINDELVEFIKDRYVNDKKEDGNTEKVRCRNCGHLVDTEFEHAEPGSAAGRVKWKC